MENNAIKKENALKFLIGKFKEMEDYRDSDRLNYTLVEILFLTLCGCLSGCSSYEEISDFGKFKLSWLRKQLPYANGIPSHDTICRVLGILNTRQLEKALVDYCSFAIQLPEGTVVNIDGKRISRSVTVKEQQTKIENGGKQAINMVNVFCSLFDSCLASVRVASKSGEKEGLKDILEWLDLSNCLLTLDAAYCYTDVVEQITESNADYLIGLKGNQKNLHEAAQDLLTNSEGVQIYKEEKKSGHGREEQRTCTVIEIEKISVGDLEKYKETLDKWPSIKCLIMVSSQREILSTNKISEENRFYICSKVLDAQNANEIVRGHWAVENNLHWVLDAIFGEDDGTKRNGNSAANFSLIRKLAFNKLKAFEDPKVSMNRRMKRCAMNDNYLENTLEKTVVR